MPLQISIRTCRGSAWRMPFTRYELADLLHLLAHAAGDNDFFAEGALDLALLDDRAMEVLHQRVMSCTGPTNVLAFPALSLEVRLQNAPRKIRSATGQSGSLPRHLGSIALSVDTLARECFLYGQEPKEHCIRLLAHATAHVLGLDHGPDMWALTKRMEAAAACFAAPEPPSPGSQGLLRFASQDRSIFPE